MNGREVPPSKRAGAPTNLNGMVDAGRAETIQSDGNVLFWPLTNDYRRHIVDSASVTGKAAQRSSRVAAARRLSDGVATRESRSRRKDSQRLGFVSIAGVESVDPLLEKGFKIQKAPGQQGGHRHHVFLSVAWHPPFLSCSSAAAQPTAPPV